MQLTTMGCVFPAPRIACTNCRSLLCQYVQSPQRLRSPETQLGSLSGLIHTSGFPAYRPASMATKLTTAVEKPDSPWLTSITIPRWVTHDTTWSSSLRYSIDPRGPVV